MFHSIHGKRGHIDRGALDLIASVLPRDLLEEALQQVDAIHR